MSLSDELARVIAEVEKDDNALEKEGTRVFITKLIDVKVPDKSVAALFKDSVVNWRGVISRVQREIPSANTVGLVLDAGLYQK